MKIKVYHRIDNKCPRTGEIPILLNCLSTTPAIKCAVIVLQNFPGVLNVAAKNAVVFECLRKSLNEKITVKIEIDKKQEIQNCQF